MEQIHQQAQQKRENDGKKRAKNQNKKISRDNSGAGAGRTDSHPFGPGALLQEHRDGQEECSADPRSEVVDEAAAARHWSVVKVCRLRQGPLTSHSRRSEESLFGLNPRGEGSLASLGMTAFRI